MEVSQSAIDLVKDFEGLRLKAYQCPAGIWTIGYGTTRSVWEGLQINEKQAEEFLERDLNYSVKKISFVVNVPINQNQIDALASLIYNIGDSRFVTSTLLYLINKGKYDKAANEFLAWSKIHGKQSHGLEERRARERSLFLKKVD